MNHQHYYTEHHVWAAANPDGTFNVGISDHAQHMLGDIVFVDIPAIGTKLSLHQPCGIIESVKTASDIHAPLDGEVLMVNERLASSPELLNDAPDDTWIFCMRADHPEEASKLMSTADYENTLT